MGDKLKLCPFCGGEAMMGYSNDNHRRPYIVCKFGCFINPPCPVSHPYLWGYRTEEEEAIEAWNRRGSE